MLGLEGLIDGIRYNVRRWSNKWMKHVSERVQMRPSCTKTLKALRLVWTGGLNGPTDPCKKRRHGVEAKAKSQICGNATWQAK